MARKRASIAMMPWFDDPHYRAFEADILAHPDDDTPRLVLADWLEDHNDEHTAARAEFLRVQLELARLPGNGPRRAELTSRQTQLLAAHEAAWLGPLKSIARGEWHRGFLHRLRLGVRQFLENAELLFRLSPVLHLQLLRVSQTTIPMSELAACPGFGQLRGFTLSGSGVGDAKLTVFLTEANLANLEALELPGAGLGMLSVQSLVAANLPHLRKLDLSNNNLHHCLQHLCSTKASFKLRELNLCGTNIDSHDYEALFAWSGLTVVQKFNLAGNRLGTAGGVALAACPHLGSIRELDLTMCEIGARGIRAIAETNTFANLHELNLSNNSIRPSGLEALLSSPFIDRLAALRLGVNELGETGLVRLSDWPGLARHTQLELRANNFGPRGLTTLCSSPYLGELTHLTLSMNHLLDEGAVTLAQCEKLSSLTHLELSLCQITDAGADALLDSPHLKNLQELTMIGNSLSKACVRRILARFPESKFLI